MKTFIQTHSLQFLTFKNFDWKYSHREKDNSGQTQFSLHSMAAS